jgi:lysophospholipase L1-like esterase
MKRFVRLLAAAVFALGFAVGIAPQSASATGGYQKYVALGDSVAAGAGLPLASGEREDTVCARSGDSYPYAVAAQLGTKVSQLACSGAKVDEGMYGKQSVSGPNIEPQLDRAFANGTPDLITITIGANDLRWSQFVRDCFAWRCGSDWDDARAAAYLTDLSIELNWMFSKINTLSNGNPPKVVITGYFNPVAADQTCSDLDGVTQEEIAWLTQQHQSMNEVIQYAAGWYDFAQYVPVDFSGHELCSSDPWVQGRADAAPIHPTAAGQRAIADAVVNAL